MSDWWADITNALDAFVTVAELAGSPIRRDELDVEFLEAPHKPPASLPAGKMAIYGFWGAGEWLKDWHGWSQNKGTVYQPAHESSQCAEHIGGFACLGYGDVQKFVERVPER